MADALDLALRALALDRAGDPAAATSLLRAAAGLAPESAEIHANLALFHEQEGDFPAAVAAWRHALKLRPGDRAVRQALQLALSRADLVRRLLAEGVAHSEQDRIAEAEACFARVVRLAPRSVVARGNLAALLLRRGKAAEAARGFEEALRLVGPSEDANRVRADSAVAYLLLGDFARGWPAFEARWALAGYRETIERIAIPRWTGAGEIAGKRVLVLAEQGFGDIIQFVRYARLLAARGAAVVLMVPRPLLRLLAPLGEVLALDDPLPAVDFYCPMLSLPLAFGTDLGSIPADIPYLFADAGRWRARLAGLPGRKVGLVWAGGAHADEPESAAMDRRRSLPPGALAPLAAVAGVSLVSLQKDRPAGESGLALHDWMGEVGDFADTAGLVAGLDLVISVDTAVAHLAGALGREVWLLNRFDTCWRWLLGREDSPWYPGLRQFRQVVPGDWSDVVARVVAALGD
jgi:Flp pilus assembly protein TadD